MMMPASVSVPEVSTLASVVLTEALVIGGVSYPEVPAPPPPGRAALGAGPGRAALEAPAPAAAVAAEFAGAAAALAGAGRAAAGLLRLDRGGLCRQSHFRSSR